MNEDFLPFGGPEYFLMLLLLLVARGADFFSTWTATPGLKLEANPLARRLGWRGGLLLNALICLAVAVWLLPAVTLITTSLLVAARNFHSAWLSRTMGEHAYREWLARQLRRAQRGLFFFCLGAQSAIHGALAAAIMILGREQQVLLGIGLGIAGYAVAVPLFTWLGVRGVLRQQRRELPLHPFHSDTDVFSDQRAVPGTGQTGEPDSRLSPSAG